MGFLDRLLGREKKDESEAAGADEMGQEGMHQPGHGMADAGAEKAEGMADTGAEGAGSMADAGADRAEGMAQDARTEAGEQGMERENP